MGAPGDDVARLAAVLELASERGLTLACVRVGDVELRLTSPSPTAEHSGERPPSAEELARIRRDEFLATMYAASEGPDLGGFD